MRKRRLAWWILLGLVLGVVALGAEGPDEGDRYDAIVVLGCRVDPDGTASQSLYRRASQAADLYHRGLSPVVITTGGVGEYGASEASVAAAILESKGVPADRIVREETSTSTWENAANARRLFGPGRVLVVSDRFHGVRAERVFRAHFGAAHAVGSESPFPHTRRQGAMRETWAILIYAALGRLDA